MRYWKRCSPIPGRESSWSARCTGAPRVDPGVGAQWQEELQRTLGWMKNFTEMVANPKEPSVGPTPRQEIYRKNKSRLYRYESRRKYRTPLLFVPHPGRPGVERARLLHGGPTLGLLHRHPPGGAGEELCQHGGTDRLLQGGALRRVARPQVLRRRQVRGHAGADTGRHGEGRLQAPPAHHGPDHGAEPLVEPME